MPALSDIPTEYLAPEKKVSFIGWLLTTPIDYGTRRALIRLWSAHTEIAFTSGEFDLITTAPEP